MHWTEELSHLLRPAGGGVYVVSTGGRAQKTLQRRLYGTIDPSHVRDRFAAAIDAVPKARGILLGLPSDVGAGLVRGANMGPSAIRSALLDEHGNWSQQMREFGIIDIGDVFTVPQLLHDDMLNDEQKAATRAALYPDVDAAHAAAFPVSPLSIAERALDIILAVNPEVAVFVIGGDHSCSWPVAAALHHARSAKHRWAIVQSDAHTDLLAHRLGIKYCFATWSYHANELFGRDGRLVQVGVRVSRHDRAHWERALGVRQFWANECREQPEKTIESIIEHLKRLEVDGVYFSNDIDGTDDRYALATGTPEAWGLTPHFLFQLIRRLGDEIGLIGGDIMEVAPPLSRARRSS